jgi:putative transcriptional regulator
MDKFLKARNSGLAARPFEGRYLVSMPDMQSEIFANSVIYVCLHNEEGALGFILNKPAVMTLAELLAHAEVSSQDYDAMDPMAATSNIMGGGPVDEHRGFVLHTTDYKAESTVLVGDNLALTSTVSVLRAIAAGRGPKRSAVLLGYAGWGAGQLDDEFKQNAWLMVKGNPELVFDEDHGSKYERALSGFGINPGNFISEAGRA